MTLPGFDEAPWGWKPADVTARLGRGGAPSAGTGTPVEEPPPDPLIAEVEAAFRAAGIPLALPFRNPGPLALDVDPRLRVARREVRFTPYQPVPILSVEIYTDEATAQRAMRSVRARLQDQPLMHDFRLARAGRVVVEYELLSLAGPLAAYRSTCAPA